ncbi:hypothetical protein KJZ67_02745 [Patescibacteria group bacterium]|nr:hypothetical protein [Patescibacteria group bacterium]
MARFFHHIIVPTGRTIVMGIRFNRLVWTKYFDAAWEATPLHEKLTWVLFLSNTLAILTLLQILAFK